MGPRAGLDTEVRGKILSPLSGKLEYTIRKIGKDKRMYRIVFWDVLPCKIIVDRRFRGAY
jgi:hypothetical protein